MGKAPSAPNPVTTANAQTASNVETALANAQLSNINQVDAQGNKLTYTQTPGTNGVPQYTATQTLGAAGQALQNTNQGTQQNLATLANEQSGRLGSLLNAPIDFSAQKDYLNSLTSGALDKRWDTLGQQNETDLINRGIRPGSDQYDNLKNAFMTNQSDAYNSANVQNYNTALQSQLALRNQPLNEISALAGGSQLQSPQFANTNSPQIAGTDVAGITQNGYNQQMQQYGQNQSTLGGLFSAGASLIPLFSDIRLKTNIKRIGQHPIGVGIYEYDRVDTGAHETGVIAQELLLVAPHMVDSTSPTGMLRVHYDMLKNEGFYPNEV